MEFKLLPHKYQKTAVWILAAEILLTVVSFVVSFSAPSSSLDAFFKSGFMQLFITIGFYLAFVFLAFSRESVEDEYITSCRLKSVAITAVASVCFVVLLDLVQAFLHGSRSGGSHSSGPATISCGCSSSTRLSSRFL